VNCYTLLTFTLPLPHLELIRTWLDVYLQSVWNSLPANVGLSLIAQTPMNDSEQILHILVF